MEVAQLTEATKEPAVATEVTEHVGKRALDAVGAPAPVMKEYLPGSLWIPEGATERLPSTNSQGYVSVSIGW